MSKESEYRKRLEEGAQRLKKEKESGPKEWEELGKEQGIKVYVQTGAKPADRFLAYGEVDAPIEKVYAALYDYNLRLQWDDGLSKKSGVIDTLSEDLSLVFQLVEGKMGVSAREFVNARLSVKEEHEYVVVHNNVDLPERPVTSGAVRGKNHDIGYLLKELEGGRTAVYWFVQTELLGWVGMLNIRSITIQSLISVLKKLRAYLAQ